jgi:hypothetical protein
VVRDSSQITGRASVAIRSSGTGGGQRHRLGSLQPEPLRRQLAEDQRHVRDEDRHHDERDRVGPAVRHTPASELVGQRFGQRRGAERGREEPGQRDADLHRGQEPVGVADQPAQPLAARAPLAQ